MARFKIDQYNPNADSTFGTQNLRGGRRGVPDGFEGVILVVENGHCGCGCGNQVAKGRRFAQGHDATLKGVLIRAHLTGTKVATVTGDKAKVQTAFQAARGEGWENQITAAHQRHVNAEQARADRKTSKAIRKASRAKSVGSKRTVKLGRWTYPGTVTAVNDDGSVVVEVTKKNGEKVEVVA